DNCIHGLHLRDHQLPIDFRDLGADACGERGGISRGSDRPVARDANPYEAVGEIDLLTPRLGQRDKTLMRDDADHLDPRPWKWHEEALPDGGFVRKSFRREV